MALPPYNIWTASYHPWDHDGPYPPLAIMADLELRHRNSEYDEKTGGDSVEKASVGSSDEPIDDAAMLKEVEYCSDVVHSCYVCEFSCGVED